MSELSQAPVAVDRSPVHSVLVLVPTYNERENLPGTLGRVRAAVPDADVLVLDDNSPDGTGEVADALAVSDPAVHVLHRRGKEGLGAAYLAGFAWALERGYDVAVELDADGSHPPEHLPDMLAAAKDADLVIGSRWVPGGRVVNWPWYRKVLSVGGNAYARVLLGIDVHDATAGYRVYRMSALQHIGLEDVESQGYCFQVDLTRRAVRSGLRVVEVPITFVERTVGQSKMSNDIVREALTRILVWGVQHRLGQLRRAVLPGNAWHRT